MKNVVIVTEYGSELRPIRYVGKDKTLVWVEWDGANGPIQNFVHTAGIVGGEEAVDAALAELAAKDDKSTPVEGNCK